MNGGTEVPRNATPLKATSNPPLWRHPATTPLNNPKGTNNNKENNVNSTVAGVRRSSEGNTSDFKVGLYPHEPRSISLTHMPY